MAGTQAVVGKQRARPNPSTARRPCSKTPCGPLRRRRRCAAAVTPSWEPRCSFHGSFNLSFARSFGYQIGDAVAGDLESQRNQLLNAHEKVGEMRSFTGDARRLLNEMGWRDLKQKLVLVGIIIVLIVAIILVVYYRFLGGGDSSNGGGGSSGGGSYHYNPSPSTSPINSPAYTPVP